MSDDVSEYFYITAIGSSRIAVCGDIESWAGALSAYDSACADYPTHQIVIEVSPARELTRSERDELLDIVYDNRSVA
jgi:pyruvate carboxylase